MKAASKTDTGKIRTNNEDRILMDKEHGIFILADGMGGHNAGEVASELAVREAHSFILNKLDAAKNDSAILSVLEEAILKAHDVVREKASTDLSLSGMGTTLVELIIKGEKAYICHAGDSRAYLFRDKLERLTKDHTMGDYLVERKIMTREEVPPQQWHSLTQAVGVGDYPAPDKITIELKHGDLLFLCSDGLTDMLADDEIEKIIKENETFMPKRGTQGKGNNPSSPHFGKGGMGGFSDEDYIDKTGDVLIEEANKKGGRDNISVVLVSYSR